MRHHLRALLLGSLLVAQAGPLHCEGAADDQAPQLALAVSERLDEETVGAPVTFSIRGPGGAQGPFGLRPEDLEGLKAWQIQIFDFYGNKVSYIQGRGRPSELEIPWSGFSTEGKPLRDGGYRARLVWTDAAGFHKTKDESVMLMAPAALKGLYAFDLRFLRTSRGLSIGIGSDLLFAAGRHDLQAQVIPTLEKIAGLLRARERNKVLVRGFTDSIGATLANLILSRRRAQAVFSFLAARGIAGQRMTYEGLGSQEAIDSNATDLGRQRNRRVEVVLLDERI